MRCLVALVAVAVAGCSKKEEAPQPMPAPVAPAPAIPEAPLPPPNLGSAHGLDCKGWASFQELTCDCPPPDPKASVWGVAQYTADSNVCTAALHAGVVGPSGGLVQVARSQGCSAYSGSTTRGVTTRSYAAFSGSFYFPASGDASCSQTFAVAEPKRLSRDPCPSMLAIGATGGAACECRAPIAAQPIWGANPYTIDSGLCAAAIHAGAIDARGGNIAYAVEEACDREPLSGAVKHGIASHDGRAEARRFRIVIGAERVTSPCAP